MPIISDIASLGNLLISIISKFLKTIIEKPHYLIPVLLIVLFFPLDLFDWLINFAVNIFIILINIIIILVVMLFNTIYGFLAATFNRIVVAPLNDIIGAINGIPPGFNLPTLDWLPTDIIDIRDARFDRIDLNLFGEDPVGSVIEYNSLFEYILSLFGITVPIW